jgi:hypothetical protein
MLKSGVGFATVGVSADLAYNLTIAKPVHIVQEGVAHKIHCWLSGQQLPFNPETFVPRKPIIYQIVDSTFPTGKG